jgi:ketosteroid isomerase-like protein
MNVKVTETKAELRALYHEWMTAIQRQDFEALDKIIGPEYTYAATNQGKQSRKEWFDTVPEYRIEAFELQDLDVLDFGHTAVAVCKYRQEAVVRGSPRSGIFLITDTWLRRDNGWQVVARSSIMMG